MLGPTEALNGLAERSQQVLANPDVIWVILVCGLMGSLIGLLLRSGASATFADKLSNHIKGRRSTLMAAWSMGIFLFVDDYLNSLAVGTAMRKLSDKYKVSREMLAYVVDSTAAPISVIIPVSTWAVFFGKLMETNNIAPPGQGVSTYITAIPYMLYPWFAVLMIPLVVSGIIPLIGPMKKSEKRAKTDGKCVPPGAKR